MQTQLQQTPAAVTYYRGCKIKLVPFSKPAQYEAIGRVHDSYAAAQQAIDGAFKTLAATIVKY